MYVLSFIHYREMRSVFVVVCFKLSVAPFYAARSSLTAFAGGFSVEKLRHLIKNLSPKGRL